MRHTAAAETLSPHRIRQRVSGVDVRSRSARAEGRYLRRLRISVSAGDRFNRALPSGVS